MRFREFFHPFCVRLSEVQQFCEDRKEVLWEGNEKEKRKGKEREKEGGKEGKKKKRGKKERRGERKKKGKKKKKEKKKPYVVAQDSPYISKQYFSNNQDYHFVVWKRVLRCLTLLLLLILSLLIIFVLRLFLLRVL